MLKHYSSIKQNNQKAMVSIPSSKGISKCHCKQTSDQCVNIITIVPQCNDCSHSKQSGPDLSKYVKQVQRAYDQDMSKLNDKLRDLQNLYHREKDINDQLKIKLSHVGPGFQELKRQNVMLRQQIQILRRQKDQILLAKITQFHTKQTQQKKQLQCKLKQIKTLYQIQIQQLNKSHLQYLQKQLLKKDQAIEGLYHQLEIQKKDKQSYMQQMSVTRQADDVLKKQYQQKYQQLMSLTTIKDKDFDLIKQQLVNTKNKYSSIITDYQRLKSEINKYNQQIHNYKTCVTPALQNKINILDQQLRNKHILAQRLNQDKVQQQKLIQTLKQKNNQLITSYHIHSDNIKKQHDIKIQVIRKQLQKKYYDQLQRQKQKILSSNQQQSRIKSAIDKHQSNLNQIRQKMVQIQTNNQKTFIQKKRQQPIIWVIPQQASQNIKYKFPNAKLYRVQQGHQRIPQQFGQINPMPFQQFVNNVTQNRPMQNIPQNYHEQQLHRHHHN